MTITTPPFAAASFEGYRRARCAGDRRARALAVREDHRRFADLKRVAHRLGRNVAEVDEHAEPVHLVNDRPAEGVDPVPLGVVGRAVGELVVLEMRERHVARAEIVELSQRCEASSDLVAALDPDQRSDLARLVDANDIIGGERELEVVGIGFDDPLDGVDLLERVADRVVAGDVRRDVDRPELRADAALMKPCHVGHQRMVLPLVRAAGEPIDAHCVILA